MSGEDAAPKAMQGATHVAPTGELVKAVQWAKDGDHPMVERYPIERREYKGLLRVKGGSVNKDLKFALRFGDWIIEDAEGRITIKSPGQFDAYKAIHQEGEGA